MNKYKNAKFLLIAIGICLVLAAGQAWGGTTGKIFGQVIDQETGEPIPGAAVSIVGTTLGMLTDEEGRFVILSVPVGGYVVKAQLVGYAPLEVSNVRISVDLATAVDIKLISQAVEFGTIHVRAERPLVIKDQTSSLRIIEREQISSLPTRSYQDIVGYQAGVVQFVDNVEVRQRGGRESTSGPNTINIRGGRRSEVAYFVDGFIQQDPQSGLTTTTINQNAVEEVSIVTGGFNAEYGWVSSGAVNVTTKDGGGRYSGTLEVITDHLSSRNFDYNIYAGDFSGPVPGWSDKMTFYLSGERRYLGDRAPRATTADWYESSELPSNWLSGYSWQGKLNWNVTRSAKFKLGILGSHDDWMEYFHAFYFNREHAPRYRDFNNSVYGKLIWNVNPRTFFTTAVNYYTTERQRGDGAHFDDLLANARPDGNSPYLADELFYLGDNPATLYGKGDYLVDPNSTVYTPTGDTILIRDDRGYQISGRYKYQIDSVRAVADSLGALIAANAELADSLDLPNPFRLENLIITDEHNRPLYADEGAIWGEMMKRKSSYIGFQADINSQVHKNHELKAGIDVQYHTLRHYQNLATGDVYKDTIFNNEIIYNGGGFNMVDRYGYDALGNESDNEPEGTAARHPYNMALYLQDKFEWEGLVVNAGLRWDYLNVNSKRLKTPSTPLGEDGKFGPEDFEDAKREQRLSPRLGIGFPIDERTSFHISYGKFFQRPDLQNLYVGWDFMEYMLTQGSFYYPFGNPNLAPEKTTAYEVGIAKQVGDYSRLTVTAYYKDVDDLTEVVNNNVQEGAKETTTWAVFSNADFGTIKGLELTLNMRRNHSLALDISYSLSQAKGTGSWPKSQYNVVWGGTETPRMTSHLDFDQRHKFSVNIDVRANRGEGPQWGDWYPLANAGINFLFRASSGTPYTPVETWNEVSLAARSPTPEDAINSRYGPWTYRLDLKANKIINLGHYNLDLYFWVLNVFDRKNVIDVYESSGQANTTGWLNTEAGKTFLDDYAAADYTGLSGYERYQLRQNNPNSFDIPRQVRFGAKISF